MKSLLIFPLRLTIWILNRNKWCYLFLILPILLQNCGKEDQVTGNPDETDYPVNKTVSAELVSKGVPLDIADFFAASKLESSRPDSNTFVYNLFYPNGAVRELTLKFTPHRSHTPTTEEKAADSSGKTPLYGFTYANTLGPDYSGKLQMSWFVPDASVPTSLLSALQKSSAETGVNVAWSEIAKTGADVTIGSILDYAKDKGVNVGKIGIIYAMASAAAAVSGSMQLSQQHGAWQNELNELEQCAAHPTNQVAKSDPNYITNTVKKVQDAKSELKEVTAVRFLNQMTETGSGITPVTSVMSVGLKQGFVWSEQTLGDYSENTIMREARLAVVKCGDPGDATGNIDVLWECTLNSPSGQVDHEVVHTKSEVIWKWDATSRMYIAYGSYDYSSVKTSSLNGKTCTLTQKGTGNLDGSGRILVFDDPALQAVFGFAYSAQGSLPVTVAQTESCGGKSGPVPYTLEWLPEVSGYPGTGGSMEGTRTSPSCIGTNATGTQVIEYEFALETK